MQQNTPTYRPLNTQSSYLTNVEDAAQASNDYKTGRSMFKTTRCSFEVSQYFGSSQCHKKPFEEVDGCLAFNLIYMSQPNRYGASHFLKLLSTGYARIETTKSWAANTISIATNNTTTTKPTKSSTPFFEAVANQWIIVRCRRRSMRFSLLTQYSNQMRAPRS